LENLTIAVVCPYYPWPPSVGGVENTVKTVSVELARRGHEVHVVCSNLGVTPMKKTSDVGVEERDGVIIHSLEPSGLRVGYARFLKDLKKTIKNIQPTVVHSHNLHPHLFQLARWRSEFSYKLVAELHHPAVTIDTLAGKVAFPFAVWRLRSTHSEIDAFVAHTSLEKTWLIEKGIKPEKVSEIFLPGVPLEMFSYKSDPSASHNLLFVGRIMRTKGLHILVEAMSNVVSKVKDVSLILAGPENPEYIRSLRSRLLELGLEEYVCFVGPVFGRQKYNLMVKSALFVLPSLREYTPNVLLEAEALGIPVVASRIGAVSEMMVDGETGRLINSGDSAELGEVLGDLLLDDATRAIMAKKAREFSRRFTLDGAINKLESAYLGLTEQA
jgi:glycosyltransferase involved in cell wall biosynthesis